MGSSIEMPKELVIVCGDMAYDAEKETIECPPSTVNNKKKIPQAGRILPEGEMTIKLESCIYSKDENGKIIEVKDVPEMPKITGDFKGTIADNGEIIRQTSDSER